jgi:DNA-binding NarL/FixJ family response regulator
VTSVLVIDDHPIVLQACRRLLEDAGVASVLEAGDVAAGYELFAAITPTSLSWILPWGKTAWGACR